MALVFAWLLVVTTAYTVARGALGIRSNRCHRWGSPSVFPMSNFAAGLVSFVILLLALGLRVPIGVAMTVVGVGGFTSIQGLAPLLSFLKTTPFESFAGYCLR